VTQAVRKPETQTWQSDLDAALSDLEARKDDWARTSNAERIEILRQVKDNIMQAAKAWATTASAKKLIPSGSPLEGEEWISGPYPLMAACNLLIETLEGMDGKRFLKRLPIRDLPTGQIAARVLPHSIWDYLLLSGVSAEVWMQPGVTRSNLAQNTASGYDLPAEKRSGKVSLVLGAGNISAIAPLDCFQKLFSENQVVLLKLNPVNDYLAEVFEDVLRPLIEFGALRIVKGGADVGEYLCNHPIVEEIHITGAGASHDAIVWGAGKEGLNNKQAGKPKNTRRITSELGAVCPTIIVPGPWSNADIKFQAEQVATQKLHNSGFNCVACQMLVVPENWAKTDRFIQTLEQIMANAPDRPMYYPGAGDRVSDYTSRYPEGKRINSDGADSERVVIPFKPAAKDHYAETQEVFAPVMTQMRLPADDAESYLRGAIAYCNDELYGTLGANIVIHPATKRQLGAKFDELLAELRYGCIAVNAWTGVGFLAVQTPWGAFPGHSPDDVQSGIGMVHNTFMFDKPERTVVTAPFRPFPRTLLSGGLTLLPRPPWFVTNRKAHIVGKLLTRFTYRPSFLKLPRIFMNALMG